MFSLSPALVGFGISPSLFAAFALLPQVVAGFASINFSSVKQCEAFTVDFAGGKAPAALPLSLTVLPLNGTPITIPLPSDAWNPTTQVGAAITFLPYPAGTQFIASLDDADGQGTALVSDVLVVDPSDSGNTSCLPTNSAPFAPEYSVDGSLAQCQSFSIDFDPNLHISSPTVRAFVPKGPSFPVKETEANDTSGQDTYLMDVPRGSVVVLMYTDTNTGHRETSTILPVLGDINSETSCIPTNPLAAAAATLEMSTTSEEHVTPKIAIIVIAVCIGVIAVVAAVMIAWYFLHRRKARKFTKLDDTAAASPTHPSSDPEKQMQQVRPPRIMTTTAPTMPSPLSPTESGYGAFDQFVENPPYIRMGSSLITPTSPDPKDPFGEKAEGSILGSLSAAARDDSFSFTANTNAKLGPTALGNNLNGSSTLALAPRSRIGSPSPSFSPSVPAPIRQSRSQSQFDPTSEPIPGTSPYWGGRLAVTPDNSLASHPNSILRRHISTGTTTSVSSVEIDHILEMATIYGSGDIVPDLPQPLPALTAPATLRSSAYMAGFESRRQSIALSSPGSASPRTHSRNNSAATTALSHTTSHTRLRAFREPPLATLPSSPLPSPGVRPSFDIDVEAGAEAGVGSPKIGAATPRPLRVPGPVSVPVPVPVPPPAAASRTDTASVYSVEGDLGGFTMIQPRAPAPAPAPARW